MDLFWLEDILVPLGICVALPVLIVWLVMRARQNEMNRKTEVMLKAIEAGVPVDADFFKSQRTPKTIKERLLKRLTAGSIFTLMGIGFTVLGIVQWVQWDGTTSNDSFVAPLIIAAIWLAVGISLLIAFFIGRKMLAKEIEVEEKALTEK